MTAKKHRRYSQLSPHHAERSDIPGRYGPVAALHARASGPSAGTVLLLPGYTGSKEDFAPLLDPIAGSGIDAVAIDLPGQYESPGPEVEAEYRPSNMGSMIVELVEQLATSGRPVLLLGHSYGGLVARSAVLGGAPISGLTLLSSGPAGIPPGDRRDGLDRDSRLLAEVGIVKAQQIREEIDSQTSWWSSMPERLKALLRERFLRSVPAGLLGVAQALRDEPDLVGPLAERLRAIGAACNVVCGADDDAWFPATQKDMALRLDADFMEIPAAAHSPNTENPEALLDVLLPAWHSWLGTAGSLNND